VLTDLAAEGSEPGCQRRLKSIVNRKTIRKNGGNRIMAEVISPMAGKIFKIEVKVGDQLEEGDEVVILEAMKMEMPVVSPCDGTVKEIKVAVGDAVESDTVIAVIE
jgi:acetyl-CoA carboxylase biotin carboxyl carrier protein